MQLEITSFLFGMGAGVLALAVFVFPRIARTLTRTASVVLLGSGVGLLTWSIDSMIRATELRPLGWERLNISTPSEALACGVGCLVAGTLALVLSFFIPIYSAPRMIA
jgi:hypothetical protein